MKKKAIISVQSKQNGNDDEPIEVVTPGNFFKKDNSYYAIYDETKISGMEGTTTTLKINDNKLSLIRIGNTSTRMDFEVNKANVSMYTTPYGTLELKVNTSKMDIDIDENGGSVRVDYNLSVSGNKTMKTFLQIKIETKEN